MSTNIDAIAIRRVLGRLHWRPPQPHGPDGWSFVNHAGDGSIIVSNAPTVDLATVTRGGGDRR